MENMNLIVNLIFVLKIVKYKIEVFLNCSFYFLENNYYESVF